MHNQLQFAMVAVFLLIVVVTGYRDVRAAAFGEKISRTEEGRPFAIALRLTGFCLFLVNFAYLIVPFTVKWATISNPLPWHRSETSSEKCGSRGSICRMAVF